FGKQMRQRRSPIGLHDGQFGEAINDAKLEQFQKTLAERRAVSHISPGYDHMVGHAPSALPQEFGGHRLLALDAKRINRIDQVDGLLFGEVQKTVDRKSTRLNSSHGSISYAVFCLQKKHEQT